MRSPNLFTTGAPSIGDYEARLAATKCYRSHARSIGDDKHPLVTVVTAVLNNMSLLRETIDSVRAQDYPNIEYIIVDGGSTDGTLEVIDEGRDVVSLWISEPDCGLYDAINKGIALGSGKYFHILNSDDRLRPQALSLGVATLYGAEDTCFYGPLQYVMADGTPERRRGKSDRAFWLPRSFPFLHPTWLVPRRLHETHGLYRTEFPIAADMEMYYRLTTAKVPFHYVDEVTVDFRYGGVSHNLAGLNDTWAIHRHYSGLCRAIAINAFSRALRLRNRMRQHWRQAD